MHDEYLGYPVVWIPTEMVEYNDDVLYLSAGSLREGESGWWSPEGHPNRKYLQQTGSFLRAQNGEAFSKGDHLRSRLLYRNVKNSIERDGLQSPLVAVQWANPEDSDWTIPSKWPMWSEYWSTKRSGIYWRVMQGCTRLLVLKDLGWERIPIIDITREARTNLSMGICPTRAWLDDPHKGVVSKNSAEHVGFMWDDAHSKDLKL